MIIFNVNISENLLKSENSLEVTIDDWKKRNYMHNMSYWL
jgi:beta-galactosidase/beta-glucuronidase